MYNGVSFVNVLGFSLLFFVGGGSILDRSYVYRFLDVRKGLDR